MDVTIWICPNDCSYYAAPSAGQLTSKVKQDIWGRPRGTRDACPSCGESRESFVVSAAHIRRVSNQRAKI